MARDMGVGKELSFKIKSLRGNKSQQWLADKAGIARLTINRWENKGTGSMTLETLERIAAAFDCAPWELIRPSGANSTSINWTRIQELFIKLAAIDEAKLPLVLDWIGALAPAEDSPNLRSARDNKAK